MVTICWKRTITARSMRSLFAAAHSIRNDVRALHFTTGLDIFSKEHFTNVFSTESEKYRDAKMIDDWEIAEENLLVIKNEILGKGAFSICYKGILKGRLPINRVFKTLNLTFDPFANTDSEVAVKVLPAYADDINRANFLHEIEFMKNLGYHTHIISLIGCVSNRFAPKIVTELCANGDVLRFLRTNKSRFVLIGDFGLCRYTDQALYNTQGGRLPIKWMAIESLKWYEYTTKSDVYELMKQCWQESPQRRPTFTQISAILSEILRADDAANDYLSMIAEPSEHDGHC
uniref:Protein kinase domain-containing protein n=1 Tax=Parascaris univalens TaxID=6257 RepID=A0A915C369_PARUN